MSESRLTLPMAAKAGAVFSAVMAIQMKNLEAMAAVQKAAMQGMSTLAKQQQAMLTSQLQGTASLPATLSVANRDHPRFGARSSRVVAQISETGAACRPALSATEPT